MPKLEGGGAKDRQDAAPHACQEVSAGAGCVKRGTDDPGGASGKGPAHIEAGKRDRAALSRSLRIAAWDSGSRSERLHEGKYDDGDAQQRGNLVDHAQRLAA